MLMSHRFKIIIVDFFDVFATSFVLGWMAMKLLVAQLNTSSAESWGVERTLLYVSDTRILVSSAKILQVP